MKSVPNLISYPHKFLWNFSQFLAIYFELFSSGVISAFRAGPACQRAVATWLPRARTASLTRLKGAVGTVRRRPDSRLPTARPASRAPTAPSPTASPCALPATAVRNRPRVFKHAKATVYPIRPPVSTPRHRILAPPSRANPLHRRPCRSPPNRRAARRRRPRLVMPPDAAVYTHEFMCR
jgi:hypothetical protein